MQDAFRHVCALWDTRGHVCSTGRGTGREGESKKGGRAGEETVSRKNTEGRNCTKKWKAVRARQKEAPVEHILQTHSAMPLRKTNTHDRMRGECKMDIKSFKHIHLSLLPRMGVQFRNAGLKPEA
eukprot:3815371-Amphidinium_carterae.1